MIYFRRYIPIGDNNEPLEPHAIESLSILTKCDILKT